MPVIVTNLSQGTKGFLKGEANGRLGSNGLARSMIQITTNKYATSVLN
jgi:hypothetical protein